MSPVARAPVRPQTLGPVELTVKVCFGLVSAAISAWIVGVLIEIGGTYTIWKNQGAGHARSLVEEDLGYIAAAPRSILVGQTVPLSRQIVHWVQWPYERFGILKWHAKAHPASLPNGGPATPQEAGARTQDKSPFALKHKLKNITSGLGRVLSEWALITMYVAMDVLLRMSIAVYALPAFVLACMMGMVDGLVRRDIRRWSGGRESSFVYHHAKRYTGWALTGGFGLYLTWPFGGFNPAYMVLVFTVLVAISLSTTVAAFKKYA